MQDQLVLILVLIVVIYHIQLLVWFVPAREYILHSMRSVDRAVRDQV